MAILPPSRETVYWTVISGTTKCVSKRIFNLSSFVRTYVPAAFKHSNYVLINADFRNQLE
jgi:hypothetical protein